jgi:hypothetical protein
MALALNVATPFPNARPLSNVDGATVEVFVDITGDASYPNTGTFSTSGYTLTPAQLGMSEVLYVDCGSLAGYVVHYDYANQRLHFFQSAAAGNKFTEVANTTNLSTVTGRMIAIGKGFPTIGTSV